MTTLRLGTRGSLMALAQANHVADLLRAAHPTLTVQIVTVSTHGDRWTGSLHGTAGKGAFVRELDQQLAAGAVDLAVHCLKDIAGDVPEPEHLAMAGYLRRDDPRDALVAAGGLTLAQLPSASVVGTSAMRRQAQLLRQRPDLRTKPLRGNIDARLQRVDFGDVDAVVVSAAGLHRVGMSQRISELLPVDLFAPAAGAGIIVVATRAGDTRARDLAAVLNDADTEAAAAAERAFLRRLRGNCNSCVAAHADVHAGTVTLRTSVYSPNGDRVLHTVVAGPCARAPRLGKEAAEQLLSLGARKLLDANRS